MKFSLSGLLRTFTKGDYFNVISFSDTAKPFFSPSDLKLVKVRDQMAAYLKSSENAT
jgi:hypothetical protein